MNYEELYAVLTETEKKLRDAVNTGNRTYKTVVKDTESGNLADLKKCLETLAQSGQQLTEAVAAIQRELESFETKEYFVSGDFTRQLLEACRDKGIDVKGDKGVYEMFPFKVRITGDDEHAEELYINRKKQSSYRPSAVAETIRAAREKLYKSNFNDQSFMTELAEAYETACLKQKARIGTSIVLTKIYKAMAPMARARKEYDMQAYSFDLARLYEKGPEAWISKTGQRYDFGTSRDGKNGIRVLNSAGREDYLLTLRQVQTEEE